MTGAISKHSALKLAYYRGVISEKLTQKAEGGMMAVGISAAEMEPLLVEVSETCSRKPLTIACINSPLSVTISGDRPQLATLAIALEKRNIFHRYLHVDLAYHSPHMEVVAAEYLEQIQSLEYGDCNRRAIMISSVTGDAINGVALNRPEYWVDNMLKPVLFSAAIKRLCFPPGSALRKRLDGSHRNYIVVKSLVEIGPHAALQGPIRDTIKSYSPSSTIGYFSAMKRASPSDKTFLSVLGQMACRGVDINFALTNKLARHEIISNQEPLVLPNLPEYPFDHSQNYWPTGRLEKEFRFRRHKKLDLLGQPAIDFNPLEPRWTNFIKSNNLPWAADHKVSICNLPLEPFIFA
jgi:acyl transferase domain-containing protein